MYSQGANEAEIFLPTSTVVLNILKRDDNDNSFLQVKIAEMCLFVSEEDLEQDKEDSNKYKVKEKLSHPIYIVDDKGRSSCKIAVGPGIRQHVHCDAHGLKASALCQLHGFLHKITVGSADEPVFA